MIDAIMCFHFSNLFYTDDYIAEKLPLPVVIHSKTEASSSCVDLTLGET